MSSVQPYVNTRGRAYECSRCGDKVVDIKVKVMAHIYETHLRIDQAPFYCSVCQEVAVTAKRLVLHSQSQRHIQRCLAEGVRSEEVLVINQRPDNLQQPRDFVKYDRKISRRVLPGGPGKFLLVPNQQLQLQIFHPCRRILFRLP